jgi:hypothetical protein
MENKLTYALMIIIAIGAVVWGLVSYNNLAQAQSELEVLRIEKTAVEWDLAQTEAELTTAQQELSSADLTITSLESELELYKDTWGSVVSSGVKPPYVGADIVNYETASNPTWTQLLVFLRNDRTDQRAYVPDVYMCGDYARDVHNNAERAGIRAAYVAVDFTGYDHALNAFKTIDRGLVFIDCTGLLASESGPSNRDKIVDVRLGEKYTPRSLFPESGWSVTWESMGRVHDVQIYW